MDEGRVIPGFDSTCGIERSAGSCRTSATTSAGTDFLLHPEDRSRFLRFVTGRSRLPARIYIYPDKLGYETTDALPESSTCSSTLFLPHYASAKVCEEKLRYAAYNCVAIDTDMSPWEE